MKTAIIFIWLTLLTIGFAVSTIRVDWQNIDIRRELAVTEGLLDGVNDQLRQTRALLFYLMFEKEFEKFRNPKYKRID